MGQNHDRDAAEPSLSSHVRTTAFPRSATHQGIPLFLTSVDCDRVIELAQDWNVSVNEAIERLVRIGFEHANEQRSNPAP